MANYTYKFENDEYIFYEDGEVLKTPHDAVIKTTNEDFAKLLIKCLEHFADFSSPTSLLTYHYTFCNLNAEYTQEFMADEFSNCVKSDMLMEDDYLLFHQPSPIRQAYAAYFENELTECFHQYNLYQLSAVLVIYTAFHSWMLSHYIIIDIIEKLYDEDADIDVLKEEFLDDLEEYECDLFDCDPEDDAYIRHRKEISDTIDAFVYYFTLEDD